MEQHQRRRVTEMMTSLLKDLGEIGGVLGGNTADIKVCAKMLGPCFVDPIVLLLKNFHYCG